MYSQNPRRRQGILILIAAVLVTAIKWLLADRLELYSDEIFYWQASQFPALAYSDLPFMTAVLAGAGAGLLGHTPFAVRLLFLLLSLLIPPLVYWLARPLHGAGRALQACGLSLCMPMLAMMGLLAVPDVAIIVFGLLFIGMLERATRLGSNHYWVLAGAVAALGLCTHYRFAPYLAAALLYMLLDRRQWHYWRSPALWLGGLIAAAGLYPALSFNLGNDLSGLDYHLVDRHPWQFQAEGLLHAPMQAAVVTPLLYALLAFTLWRMIQLARQGNGRALLFALFALLNAGTYLVLAPWADTTRTTLHWPISGYLPLLVFAPGILAELKQKLASRYSPRIARKLVWAVPISGFAGTLIVFIGIGSQGFNQSLQGLVGQGVLSNKMAGWKPLTEHVDQLFLQHQLPADTLLVTDNYYTAAQLGFAGYADRTYTTDINKIVRDGRQTQYRLWGRDLLALTQIKPANVLYLTEDSTLDVPEKTAVMNTACELFPGLAPLDQLFLYDGEKIFSFYTATGNPQDACPLPSRIWLDAPVAEATVSGVFTVGGWAINGTGISRIRVQIDSREVATASRTIDRPDVVALQQGEDDPAAPLLGFATEIDSRQLSNGRHQLRLEVMAGNGERQLASARTIVVNNPD